MIFTGDGALLKHLSDCLSPSGFYGDPARIGLAADPDTYLDGQSKYETPYLMLVHGTTSLVNIAEENQNAIVRIVERLEVHATLDAKPDKRGGHPTDQLHAIRVGLLACLHGWKPDLAAECATPPQNYGYNTSLMHFVGDDFFRSDRERITWEFDFELRYDIDSCNQGYGSNPPAIEDFERIVNEMNPTDTDPTDHPFPVADLDLT